MMSGSSEFHSILPLYLIDLCPTLRFCKFHSGGYDTCIIGAKHVSFGELARKKCKVVFLIRRRRCSTLK